MSALQWALLILAVAAVVAVYWFSRRDRRAMERGGAGGDAEPLLPPKEQQLDIFDGGFDEYGVGKPRRIPPSADGLFDPPPSPPSAEPQDDTLPQAEPTPPESASPSAAAEPEPPPAKEPPPAEQKIVALLIAERSGGNIPGPRVHQALRQQNLRYGDKQIYHRLHDERPVFSAASLVKPGVLDPAAADQLATPGLTLFMVLPGPRPPREALGDMLATADALAKSLNAQVYDATRQPLTDSSTSALRAEVDAWSRRQQALGR